MDRYLLESGSPDGYKLEDGSGVLVLNVNLVTNGTFDADASWTKGSGWTISGGVAVGNVPSGFADINQALTLAAGTTYDVSYDVTYTSGLLAVYLGSSGSGTGFVAFESSSGSKTYTHTFDAADTQQILFRGNPDFVGTIDKVVVSEQPALSVALTGQSLTVAGGSVTAAPSLALTGQSVTAARGTLTPDQSRALTGQSVTVARGSLTAAPSIELTGQSVSVAGGTLTPTFSFALSGQSLTAARGSVVPGVSFTLSGQSLSAAQGSVTATFGVALTGNAISAAQGSLAQTSGVPLVGQSLTVGQGTTAPANGIALTGVSTLIAQGSIGPAFSASLVGSALTSTLGTLSFNVVQIADLIRTAKATRRLRNSDRDYPDKWGVWR